MAKVVVRKLLKRKKIPLRAFARALKQDASSTLRGTRPDANPRLDTLSEWAKTLTRITGRKVRIRDLIEE